MFSEVSSRSVKLTLFMHFKGLFYSRDVVFGYVKKLENWLAERLGKKELPMESILEFLAEVRPRLAENIGYSDQAGSLTIKAFSLFYLHWAALLCHGNLGERRQSASNVGAISDQLPQFKIF